MAWYMRCIALEGTSLNPGDDFAGHLLASFDPDFGGGRGVATWTTNRAEAMRFRSVKEGYDVWKTQSMLMPVRADGMANRPLTAYSVEFVSDGDLDQVEP
jgi:hypothetical protein